MFLQNNKIIVPYSQLIYKLIIAMVFPFTAITIAIIDQSQAECFYKQAPITGRQIEKSPITGQTADDGGCLILLFPKRIPGVSPVVIIKYVIDAGAVIAFNQGAFLCDSHIQDSQRIHLSLP